MKRIISIIFIVIFSIFVNTGNVFANQVGNEVENDFNEEIKIQENSLDKKTPSNSSQFSNEDIFGDEQTFPFIAGFGKNTSN